MTRLIKLLIVLLLFSTTKIGLTNSYFISKANSQDNVYSAGYWIAPVISNISVLIASPNESNERTATITWDTNELTTSNLDWRLEGSLTWNSLVPDTTADNTSHLREIPGLQANKTYEFQVKSSNVHGIEAVSAVLNFQTGNQRVGLGPWSDIVINEYLPNPAGADNALMPAGEWVELYNRGSVNRDLTGWYLTDSSSSNQLPITTANIISSNPATTGLTIAPGEFMVVYRNGNSVFDLNDSSSGDTVKLYGLEVIHVGPFSWTVTALEDFHAYTWLLGDIVLENKSFARFPDGSSNWFDPIPSPNDPNVLEENPVCMSSEIIPESPTPTASNAATPAPTVTPEQNSELSASSSATTVEPSSTPTPDEPTSEPSPSLQPTEFPEPSLTLSSTPTGELESALSPSPTPSPEISLTPTPSPTLEVISPTPMPTAEPSPSPSPTLIPTSPPDPNPEPTSTPAPTSESTPTLTPAPSLESEQ